MVKRENKEELVEDLGKTEGTIEEVNVSRKTRFLLLLLCFLAEKSHELKGFCVWFGGFGFSRFS